MGGKKSVITAKNHKGGFKKWLKKVEKLVKLQIPAGKATPAPPVGPALGQAGINIMGFTKEFNARTADQAGMIIQLLSLFMKTNHSISLQKHHQLLFF